MRNSQEKELSHETRLLKAGLDPESAKTGAKFLDDIAGGDNLAIVIRAHLYMESWLNQLIEERLSEPGAVEIERQSFRFKVDLAVALDVLPQPLRQPLLVVNSFRNRLAHDVEDRITQKDVDRLFKSFIRIDRRSITSGATLTNILAYLHGCLYGQLKHMRDASKPKHGTER